MDIEEPKVPATAKYKKIDSWECLLPYCGMVVISKDTHDKWHAYREENGLSPLSKEAHEKGGEHIKGMAPMTRVRMRSDGEWPA